MSTQAEIDAFLWMQGRMVELLLRYDLPRFSATFSELRAAPATMEAAALTRLRELAVVIYLREELFEQILPRIKRRLSFAAPRAIMVEPMPTRGRIDWPRTMAANWRDLPEEPPLDMHTRQRRRHFATPENLLTVATILEYQAFAQHLLDREEARDPLGTVQHPLYDIVDACSRELIFPQFAGLEREARALIEAQERLDELEQQVAENMQPGLNSAYDDLLAWRDKLHALRLLDRDLTSAPTAMLGADLKRDNYLYQLWIFFELLSVLDKRGCIEPNGVNLTPMRVRFRWEECVYELQHDQAVTQPTVASWKDRRSDTQRVPGVRPDYYLRRVDPPVVSVEGEHGTIWREPGVIWDAKYYRERESTSAPASPIKRMIADLNLLGEPYGILLFAFLKEPEHEQANYALSPNMLHSETLIPQQSIVIRQLRPALPESGSNVHGILELLLNDAHQRLRRPADIRCHGVFLDALTVNAHGALASAAALRYRNGSALIAADTPAETALDTLLLCPKPHIGPWRIDVVSLERDCCQNAQRCHILGAGLANIQRPSRLARLEDIAQAIRVVGNDEHDERADAATRQVRVIAQRYADLIQPNLGEFTDWVRNELDVAAQFEQFPFLTDNHRETLGLGRFLWQQIDAIRASNFAGPTLLFTGVLEELVRQTIYERCPPITDRNGRELSKTLGTISNRLNRAVLIQSMQQGGCWEPQITDTAQLSIDAWADLAWRISRIRNQAAHEAQVSPSEFRDLQQLYFGSKRTGYGALNGLLLAWRESPAASA
jgi:hypothetical protein